VSPFPQQAVALTVIDRLLLQHGTVWIGGGSSAHMVSLAPSELARLTRARAADLVVPR
jgi:prolyl-tRNA editing enzyme YbaK/EbsC (Cys-tRNA(Pro) deacylase)